MKRKAQLEADRRNRQLQIEREEEERQQQIEQARINRLLDDAELLRRATNIRAYAAAVQAIVANEALSISAEKWQVGRNGRSLGPTASIPVRSARFIDTLTKRTTQIKCGSKCGAPKARSKLNNNYKYLK